MFLLILIISFLIMTPCLTYVLYIMIQPGQFLEGWQKVLDKAYSYHRFLEMFLGGCDKCFAHFISIITFIIMFVLQLLVDKIEFAGWWNVLLYFIYVPLNIVTSVILINFIQNIGKVSDLEERIKKLEDGMHL